MTGTTAGKVRAEPHRFVPPAEGTRDAVFGWCARGDCGVTADAYVHASEEERRKFDGQHAATAGHREQAEAMHFASIISRYEQRAANALDSLEVALARARQRGTGNRHLLASGAADIKRAAEDLAVAAEALVALGEVAYLASGTEEGHDA